MMKKLFMKNISLVVITFLLGGCLSDRGAQIWNELTTSKKEKAANKECRDEAIKKMPPEYERTEENKLKMLYIWSDCLKKKKLN